MQCVRGAVAIALAFVGMGFTPAALGDDTKEFTQRQREEHLGQMREVAASIRLFAKREQADSEVKLIEKPILKYSDDTRLLHESSLWIWSSGGRPSAVLAVEYYPKDKRGPRWLYEIASLSTERITAEHKSDLKWTAKEPGMKLSAIERTEAPAEKATRRLAQMKAIQRRFTAHEKAAIGGRIELRPLSSPLYRYSQEDAGILDGSIFAFANGTNPEVLLVLEAQSEQAGASLWHYSLFQMTGAAVSVELDGKEVWQRDEADPPAVRDSYVNGWISTQAGGDNKKSPAIDN